MKKLLFLIPSIFLMACGIDINLTFDEKTSSGGTSSSSTIENDSDVTTSLPTTTNSSSSTTVESSSSDSSSGSSSTGVMFDETCDVADPSCETGKFCIIDPTKGQGQCVISCTNDCPDDLICVFWDVFSEPQLPAGFGVCLPRKPCSLIAGDPSDCLATETCIGEGNPDWIGICATTCVDNCAQGVCTQWDKVSKPPLAEKVGVCL